MTRDRVAVLGCLLAAILGCPTARTDSRATLSGKVTLVPLPGLNDMSRVRVDLGRGEGGVTPSESGDFEIGDVEPDTYSVSVTYVGGLSPTATRSAYQRLETRAVARAGSSVRLDLAPQRALGSVEGTVNLPGNSATEAEIELTFDDGRRVLVTTVGGRFHVDNVPVGVHTVSARAAGFAVLASQTSACAPGVSVEEEGFVATVAGLGLAPTRAAVAPGAGEVVRERPTVWFLSGADVTVHVDAAYARSARHWSTPSPGGVPAYDVFPANGFAISVAQDTSVDHFFQFADGCGYESPIYPLTLVRDATPPDISLVQLNEGAEWSTDNEARSRRIQT